MWSGNVLVLAILLAPMVLALSATMGRSKTRRVEAADVAFLAEMQRMQR